ncbi:MAG: class I SAM-dependent methyltransferase [Bifidobacteriaceae bacterium]|jgi:predicted O-methyltransferase YrrM|nr:class I SAM-dependent methyltransferase [Bifidobacteriaceae bacterium]
MMLDSTANWTFCEDFLPMSEVELRARARARELGLVVPSPGACRLLAVLAASLRASLAVEIGCSGGVSALAILSGMPEGGVLTSVDAEMEHLRAAKEAFTEAGVAASSTRLINSRPSEVLPRLADGAYDMVLLACDKAGYPDRLGDAMRLLRPGGLLAVDGALGLGRVPDPARRDPITVAVREVDRQIRDQESQISALVPSGDGLLLTIHP